MATYGPIKLHLHLHTFFGNKFRGTERTAKKLVVVSGFVWLWLWLEDGEGEEGIASALSMCVYARAHGNGTPKGAPLVGPTHVHVSKQSYYVSF